MKWRVIKSQSSDWKTAANGVRVTRDEEQGNRGGEVTKWKHRYCEVKAMLLQCNIYAIGG